MEKDIPEIARLPVNCQGGYTSSDANDDGNTEGAGEKLAAGTEWNTANAIRNFISPNIVLGGDYVCYCLR